MKVLIVADKKSDFTEVLASCSAETERISFYDAIYRDLSVYDAFCILPKECGEYLDPRLREKLERENRKGKRVFLQAVRSFHDHLCKEPEGTVKMRLIYVEPGSGAGIPGFATGDLLDDEANRMSVPEMHLEDMTPLLIYKEHIIAHIHTDMGREEILKEKRYGLWKCGDSILWAAFILRNFNEARFGPRDRWQALIRYLVRWITGGVPSRMPEAVVRYGTPEDVDWPEVFEKCRREAIDRGIAWLDRMLIDEGRGGIKEGIGHNIDPDGNQAVLPYFRTDCTGECAGAYKMYAYLNGKADYASRGREMDGMVYGPMMIREGVCSGMMRWCMNSWSVCYQDDVARAVLPGLYDCLFMGDGSRMEDICSAMDFLVKTTARDGLRIWRTDKYDMDEASVAALADQEHGVASAHYNSYYHAALLLAGKISGREKYIDTGRRGLETLMGLYPETVREQSETQEMCRLVLPLSILYQVTGEEGHRDMLYRVAKDLQRVRHPFGGYMEWDEGYKASFSRESLGECSLLTKNGDPVADLLYSNNWLPMGFAYAWHATGDEWFGKLWRDSVAFCLRTQMHSENPLVDGAWCRGFDMDLKEAYAVPHDAGWACCASETGWTVAEILMGMMMPDIMDQSAG